MDASSTERIYRLDPTASTCRAPNSAAWQAIANSVNNNHYIGKDDYQVAAYPANMLTWSVGEYIVNKDLPFSEHTRSLLL